MWQKFSEDLGESVHVALLRPNLELIETREHCSIYMQFCSLCIVRICAV